MIENTNKISYSWILLWVITHTLIGILSFYLEHFRMAFLLILVFPIIEVVLLSIIYDRNRTPFWLLIYLFYILSLFLNGYSVPLIILLIIDILLCELLLYFISTRFNNFIFSIFSVIGVLIIYGISKIRFFINFSFEVKSIIAIVIISLFTGLGIELHRNNTREFD